MLRLNVMLLCDLCEVCCVLYVMYFMLWVLCLSYDSNNVNLSWGIDMLPYHG